MGDISYRGPLMWALSLPYGGEMCITIYQQDTSVSLPKEADCNILVGGRAHAASFLTAKAFSPWHVRRYEGTQAAYRFLLSNLVCKTCRFGRRNPSLCWEQVLRYGNMAIARRLRCWQCRRDSSRATKQDRFCGEVNAVLFCSSAGCFIINLSRSAVDLMLETAS